MSVLNERLAVIDFVPVMIPPPDRDIKKIHYRQHFVVVDFEIFFGKVGNRYYHQTPLPAPLLFQISNLTTFSLLLQTRLYNLLQLRLNLFFYNP